MEVVHQARPQVDFRNVGNHPRRFSPRSPANSIPLSATEPPANAGDDSLEHQNLELPSPPVYA